MHALTDEDYAQISADLGHRYADAVQPATVERIVAQVRAELEPGNRHPEFLTALVARVARDRVVAHISDSGREAHAVPEVLFVCQHNSARSQMAAAFAEHLGGSHVSVRAAGKEPTGVQDPLMLEAMAEKGVDLTHTYPTGLADDLLHRADVVVEMGCTVPALPATRHESWAVPDPHGGSLEDMCRARDDIEQRVRHLLSDLGLPL